MGNRVRVAVTGLGAVTPVGLDVQSSWRNLVAGSSGLAPIAAFDAEAMGFESRVGAEVKDFDITAFLDRRSARRMDRVMHFGLVSAFEAMAGAGLLSEQGEGQGIGAWRLNEELVPSDRVGVFIGTGLGGIGSLTSQQVEVRDFGPRRVSPFTVPMALPDSVPGAVAIQFGLKGPNMAHVSACASGANAIGEAFEAIIRGSADVMVTGGSEAAVAPVVVAGFQNMGALSTWQGDPVLASRPFDLERDGFVIGEGAGVLVLERYEHAQARGARIYAEMVGYGSTADAVHVTAPAEDGDGIVRAAEIALGQAGISVDDVSCINAHGTSTPLNDAVETKAMKRLLGDRAYDVPMSSVKGVIGHLLGAGGAVEAVAAVMTVATGTIPPTVNLHSPDPSCDLDYVVDGARSPMGGVTTVLSNSLGFGGHNAALLFARV